MNRQPFNRSGFNRTAQSSSGSSGIAMLKMTATAVPHQDINTPSSRSTLVMRGSVEGTKVHRCDGSATLVMSGTAKGLVIKDGGTGLAEMKMSTFGDQLVQGEAIINLRDDQSSVWLTLAPGDELIINTEEMTITINSRNGMQYFSMDSDFFKLLKGENKIVYSDASGSRDVLVDVIWKDRWL